ncbi:hypothetical protein NFI96_011963 [Prochilodus magdalenae]|nr:hypothetical protein NFI96_011963 [Prochilodus magdalenae]
MICGMKILFLFAAVISVNFELYVCTCAHNEYDMEGECCPMCEPGARIYRYCTPNTTTACVPCVDLTFIDAPNSLTDCFSCTVCDPGQRLRVKTACTPSSDTVCEPLDGYYCTDQYRGSCIFAQKHTNCSPGQYIKHRGTAFKDTECSECSDGTYSDGLLQNCLPHSNRSYSVSKVNRKTVHCAGTTFKDTECVGCENGTYSDGSFETCKRHSKCEDEEIKPGTSSYDTECRHYVPVALIVGVTVSLVVLIIIVCVIIAVVIVKCCKKKSKTGKPEAVSDSVPEVQLNIVNKFSWYVMKLLIHQNDESMWQMTTLWTKSSDLMLMVCYALVGYTIMEKTADLRDVQKAVIDTLHKEGIPQKVIAKEAVVVKDLDCRLAISVPGSFSYVAMMFSQCSRAEYEINGECCPMCAPGSRVYRHCTVDTSTTCVPCLESTYTDVPNGVTKCLSCTICDSGQGLKVKTPCTSSSDTVCEPLDGYYCTDPNRGSCRQAAEHTHCSPGQYIKQEGTAYKDTECAACSHGTFSNGSRQICQPHSKCEDLGFTEIKAGTLSTDAECGEKPPAALIAGITVLVLIVVAVLAVLIFIKIKHKTNYQALLLGIESLNDDSTKNIAGQIKCAGEKCEQRGLTEIKAGTLFSDAECGIKTSSLIIIAVIIVAVVVAVVGLTAAAVVFFRTNMQWAKPVPVVSTCFILKAAVGQGLRVKTPCTPSSDTVCEPLDGYYCTDTDRSSCRQAAEHTHCSPGQYIKQEGTAYKDTECAACSPGTFSNGSLQICQPYSKCEDLGLTEIKAGTLSTDAECGDKPPAALIAGITVLVLIVVAVSLAVLIFLKIKHKTVKQPGNTNHRDASVNYTQSCYLTMTPKGQNAQKSGKDCWKPLNYRNSTLVKGGTEMPQWSDSDFEMVIDSIVNKHTDEHKTSQYFTAKGFPADGEWTLAECKTALGYGLKHASVKECLHVIKQYWKYKLRHLEGKLEEADGKILALTTECKKHKTAAMNTQRTCKKLQQSLIKVEQQHANCKSKPQHQCRPSSVAPPPDQLCYTEDKDPLVLTRLYSELESVHSDGSDSSFSDEDYEPPYNKAVMRPITIRSSEVFNKGGEVKENRVQIGHIPLDAATLDRLSKEFKHPREMGLDFIDLMEKKRNLYSLHPNDAVAIASQVLNITDSRKLARKVLDGLGDSGQDIDKGWNVFREWISHKCRKTTNWGHITKCRQRKGESAAEYCERFERVFLRHCGIDTFNSDTIDGTTDGPHFGQLVNSLQSDLRQAMVTSLPNWRETKWGDLKNELDRLDCDLEPCNVPPSIHVLREKSPNFSFSRNISSPKKDESSECHYCHKVGHWARNCRKKQADKHKKGLMRSPARNPFRGISQGKPAENLFQGISQEQLSLLFRSIEGFTEQLSLVDLKVTAQYVSTQQSVQTLYDTGNRVYRHCTQDTSTACVPCLDSTFIDAPNGLTDCFSCAACDHGQGLRVKTPCTRSSNTVCEPLDGYYCADQDRGSCIYAQKHTKCRPGQYIHQKGTAFKDTECAECSDGTFSNGSLEICQPHSKCDDLGLTEIKAGTHSSDAECGDKPQTALIAGIIVAVLTVGLTVTIVVLLRNKWNTYQATNPICIYNRTHNTYHMLKEQSATQNKSTKSNVQTYVCNKKNGLETVQLPKQPMMQLRWMLSTDSLENMTHRRSLYKKNKGRTGLVGVAVFFGRGLKRTAFKDTECAECSDGTFSNGSLEICQPHSK